MADDKEPIKPVGKVYLVEEVEEVYRLVREIKADEELTIHSAKPSLSLLRMSIGDQAIVGHKDGISLAMSYGGKEVSTLTGDVKEARDVDAWDPKKAKSVKLKVPKAEGEGKLAVAVVQKRGKLPPLLDTVVSTTLDKTDVKKLAETTAAAGLAVTVGTVVASVAAGLAVAAFTYLVAKGVAAIFGDHTRILCTAGIRQSDAGPKRLLLLFGDPGLDSHDNLGPEPSASDFTLPKDTLVLHRKGKEVRRPFVLVCLG